MVANYKLIQSETDEQLVVKYTSLVKRIGHHLLGRLPASVNVDDLIQSGMIGLLEAAKNYDVTKGASFETYAGIRIRGMMLDEVRKLDWVPRSVHRTSRKVAEATKIIENETGRDAKDYEIAERMGVKMSEYHKILQDSSNAKFFDIGDLNHEDINALEGFCNRFQNPYDEIHNNDFKMALMNAIDKLPDREKLVFSLYYKDELNLKEIGEILNVTESRVCQIHSQTISRLRNKLEEWYREE